MKCILKIARSPKTKRLYALFDLDYTKVFIEVDDAVKLTGISYSDLENIIVEDSLIFSVDVIKFEG